MLIDFTIENWMSFRDEATLNMSASLERQHRDTLSKIPGFRSKRALPIAALYGGNASGKTGFFQAIAALKRMVIQDAGISGLLPVEPFLLDRDSESKPTVFDMTFLAGNTVYRYVLEADRHSIFYESLEVITEKANTDIFVRDERNSEEVYRFEMEFFAESNHVEYAATSTRDNQTFLGNAVAQNVSELKEAYDWFADTLELVGVESNAHSFAMAVDSREGFIEFVGKMLSQLDTGITGLEGERIDVDSLPKDAKLQKTIANLSKDDLITIVLERASGDYGFEVLTVHAGDDGPVVERLRALHEGLDNVMRSFGLGMESSGTQRLMGLLPMLFDLTEANPSGKAKVYVVDELDRCLHTMLTKRLAEDYLASCSEDTRKQLLFTTHDLLLMDQSLMRRDEMYIVQRNVEGCSELIGLVEYDGIRYDKDLIRSYLDGRFGGIPMFGEAMTRG